MCNFQIIPHWKTLVPVDLENFPIVLDKYLKQDLKHAVIEFETVKKVIPIVLSMMLLELLYAISQKNNYELFSSLTGVSVVLISAGMSSLVMYGLIISKREFRFYTSKVYLSIALDKKRGIFEQMHYFGLGLQEYNRYLKRYLKHHIGDIDKIYSKASLLDHDSRTEVIRSLSDSFETDKLKPLRYISSEFMKSDDTESVLIPESLKSQLKV